MDISNDLIKQFVQITRDQSPVKHEATVYGTVVEHEGKMYVQIDGSELLTPVETSTEMASGERVSVTIKDHSAVVTGNLSNPSAGSNTVANIKGDLNEIGTQISEFEVIIADKVSTKDFEANNATINNLIAGKASIKDLEVVNADIKNLQAEDAKVTNLVAEKATIEDLNVTNGKIENLEVNKANVTELNATNANIKDLNADIAKISTLIGGTASIDDVQTIILTSENVSIENALIKDAMIDNITANKIASGTINTNNINIQSEDGGIVIADSTQQFKDQNGKVRVQIGKDAQGNFTFCLFSQDGTGILLDETGIKAGAVPDGLVVNDMVADNANISGGKLDISSVVTAINGNSTTINSSIIKFDDTGQSLTVAFNSLKQSVSSIEDIVIDGNLTGVMEQVRTNTTSIQAMQGSIATLITNTTITKEGGQVIQLKDDYSTTKQTVNEINTKIGTLETNYKKTLNVSSVQYYLSTSLTSLSGGSWQDAAPAWTQGKYMWQRMKYTYTDGSTTYGTASCVAGAKGDTGEQGPQGPQGSKGDTGISITKITNYYLATNLSTEVTSSTTGWTTTIQNVSSAKKYLWNYEKVEYSSGNPTVTTPCIIGAYGDTGPQGGKGDTGATGKGISLITEYYQVSTSNTTVPTSWSTTVPELTATNRYLWNYENIKYTDNSSVDTTKKVIGVYGDRGPQGSKGDTGAQGPQGDKGATGEKGQSLTSSTPQWYLSTSNTTQTGGSWQDTMPQVTTGKYIWQRFKNIWANPTATTYTTPVLEQIEEAVKDVISKQAEFKQDLDGFKTTVSSTYTTKIEFNNLSIGGTNLWVINDLTNGHETSGDITTNSNTCHQIRKTLIPTNGAKYISYQLWNPNGVTNTSNTNRLAFYNSSKTYISSSELPTLDGNYQTGLYDIPTNASYVRLAAICGNNSYDNSILIKFEFGNKPTDWSPAPEDQEEYTNSAISGSENALNNNISSSISNATTNILNNVSDNYTAKSDYEEFKKTTSSAIEQTNASVNIKFENTTSQISNVSGELKEFKNTVATNIHFSENGIDIGKNDSPFSVNISNEKMSFKDDGEEIAYVSNKEMLITDANIENSLRLGAFKFIPRTNGNTSLVWDDRGNMLNYWQCYPNATNANYPTTSAHFSVKPVAGTVYTIELSGILASSATQWGIYNSGGYVCPAHLGRWEYRKGVWKKSFVWNDVTMDGNHTANNEWIEIYPLGRTDPSQNCTVNWVKIYYGDDYWSDKNNLFRYNNNTTSGFAYSVWASSNYGTEHLGVYGYLETGKTYKFTCNVDCDNWGKDSSKDKVYVTLFMRDIYNVNIEANKVEILQNGAEFTVAKGGRYWVSITACKQGMTHNFTNIRVQEVR